jgi:hypothetical protein
MMDREVLELIAGETRFTSKGTVLQEDGSLQYKAPYSTIQRLVQEGLVKTKFTYAYHITTVKLTAKGRKFLLTK